MTRNEARAQLDDMDIPWTKDMRLAELQQLIELGEAELRLGLTPEPRSRRGSHGRQAHDPLGGSYPQ